MLTPSVKIKRSRSRSRDSGGWLESRHSFSFGRQQDPMNTHFGRLLVNNDDRIAAGSGFDTHGDEAAIRIRSRTSGLLASRLGPGHSVTLPDAPYLHLYVPVGSVTLEGEGVLETGDAARMTASGGRRVTAGDVGAEILAWEMHAGMSMLEVRGH